MSSHAHSALLWGALAIVLFGILSATTFCLATEGIFQPMTCEKVLCLVNGLKNLSL